MNNPDKYNKDSKQTHTTTYCNVQSVGFLHIGPQINISCTEAKKQNDKQKMEKDKSKKSKCFW